MSYLEYQKKQKRHVRCVVCGHGFSSAYDPLSRTFPVYHPLRDEKQQCENHFFKALLAIYTFIHRCNISVSTNTLLENLDWRTTIMMKKELVSWCVDRGYLATDKLNRLTVPEAVNQNCQKVFENLDWNNQSQVEQAIELLKAAFEVLERELAAQAEKNKHAENPIEPMKQKANERPPELVEAKSEGGMYTANRFDENAVGIRSGYDQRRKRA